jgi:hypothetical protein
MQLAFIAMAIGALPVRSCLPQYFGPKNTGEDCELADKKKNDNRVLHDLLLYRPDVGIALIDGPPAASAVETPPVCDTKQLLIVRPNGQQRRVNCVSAQRRRSQLPAVNSNSFGSFVGWLHLKHRHYRLGSAHCAGAPRQSYHGEHY